MIANSLRPLSAILLVAACVACPAAAQAQSAADKTLAETLFREAKKLMDRDDYTAACPKLAQSQKLDPGGGTLLNLAVCHDKEGKTATAWSEYAEALALARRDGHKNRSKLAQESIAALEPRLSRLTVVVPADVDSAGLQVQLDGQTLPKEAWGVATPVDPGAHVVSVTAPGKQSFEQTWQTSDKAEAKTITVAQLVDAAVLPTPAAAPAPVLVAAPAVEPPASTRNGSGRRTVAYVAGGVGVVGLGLGTYLALHAKSLRSQSDDQCAPDCTQRGVDLNNRARSAANLANVPFAIGLVGIGTAVVLLATGGHESTQATATNQIVPLMARDSLGASWFGKF